LGSDVFTEGVGGPSVELSGLGNISSVVLQATYNGKSGGVGFDNLAFGPLTAVPEPISTVLFLVGGVPIGYSIYRKKRLRV